MFRLHNVNFSLKRNATFFFFFNFPISWRLYACPIYCLNFIVDFVKSSRPEVFCKKGIHRNSAKFTGKHLCQSLFFNKVAGLRPATLSKKRLWHRCFPVNFAKFLRTPFLQNTSGGCFCFVKHL